MESISTISTSTFSKDSFKKVFGEQIEPKLRNLTRQPIFIPLREIYLNCPERLYFWLEYKKSREVIMSICSICKEEDYYSYFVPILSRKCNCEYWNTEELFINLEEFLSEYIFISGKVKHYKDTQYYYWAKRMCWRVIYEQSDIEEYTLNSRVRVEITSEGGTNDLFPNKIILHIPSLNQTREFDMDIYSISTSMKKVAQELTTIFYELDKMTEEIIQV